MKILSMLFLGKKSIDRLSRDGSLVLAHTDCFVGGCSGM